MVEIFGRSGVTGHDPHVLHVGADVDDGVIIIIGIEDQIVRLRGEISTEELDIAFSVTRGALSGTMKTESMMEELDRGLRRVVNIKLTSRGVKVAVLSFSASPSIGLEWLVESMALLIPGTHVSSGINRLHDLGRLFVRALKCVGSGNNSGSKDSSHLDFFLLITII